MGDSSTTQRVLSASEWSGTETHSIEYQYAKRPRRPAPYVRFVNDLDVEVTVDAYYTDDFDTNRNRETKPQFYTNSNVIGWPPIGGSPGGQTTVDSLTIAAGETRSFGLQASWDVFRAAVTPTTSPSSGEFTVIDMK